MQLGILSDIHANEPALRATLTALTDEYSVDAIACLGDIVGVLGAPNACVSLVRDHCAQTVYGNHDARFFPERNWLPARDVDVAEYEQVMESLSNENYDWLTSLPDLTTMADDVTLVHANPTTDDRVGWNRGNAGVFPKDAVEVGGAYLDGGILCLGHTHRQHAVSLDRFDGLSGLVVNPGSVGFPYDAETVQTDSGAHFQGEASFAVVDTTTQDVQLESVMYDATPVADHLADWGLWQSDR